MDRSLASLVDNLSAINKKEPENEFIDSMRSTKDSLLHLLIKYQRLIKKYRKLIA